MNHFEYFTDIENHFVKRRGKHLMIGPLDWSLIESWQKRGVPLRIVLRAIDEVFDSFEQRGKDTSKIRSLKYCSDAVDSGFLDWSRAQTGKLRSAGESSAVQEASHAQHIDVSIGRIAAVSDLVPAVLKPVLEDAVAELRKLAGSPDDVDLEDGLDRVDAAIDRSIFVNRNKLLTGKLRAEVERTASEFGIEYNTEENDFKRIVARTVRSHYSIPHLGLYRL